MCCIAANAIIAGWRKTPPDLLTGGARMRFLLGSAVAIGGEAAVSRPPPTPLIEIAAITARGLAGQPMKRGTEPAGVAEANIERNRGDGQFAIRQ